jgi:hypothetical protein
MESLITRPIIQTMKRIEMVVTEIMMRLCHLPDVVRDQALKYARCAALTLDCNCERDASCSSASSLLLRICRDARSGCFSISDSAAIIWIVMLCLWEEQFSMKSLHEVRSSSRCRHSSEKATIATLQVPHVLMELLNNHSRNNCDSTNKNVK